MAVSLTEALDTLWTTTWPHYKPELIDAIFLKKNPLFWYLSQKGKVQFVDGGRDIRFPLEVDLNPTVTEISKTSGVSLTDVDPLTTVIYTWAEIAGNINRYRTEDLENRGKAAQFNLMSVKKMNLEKSMRKRLNQLMFRARGTRPSYGFYSILDLIDDDPTGSRTVGNHNQSTYTWWRNQTRTSQGVAATYLRKDMQLLYYDLEDVEYSPDIIMAHRDTYASYEDDLLEMKMITNKGFADAGFDHLVFKGTPMLKDTEASNTRLHMLNTDFLYLVLDRNMNFEMTSWKESHNQPFNRVAQIVTRGQLVCTHRASQGVLHTMTY